MRWQKNCITTEHCQALALENDTARQVQVFEAACQSGWGGKPEVQKTIRRLVTESEVAVVGNTKFRSWGLMPSRQMNCALTCSATTRVAMWTVLRLDAALLEKPRLSLNTFGKLKAGNGAPDAWSLSVSAVRMPEHRSLPEPEAVLTEAEERLNELMARYDTLENQCEESDLLEAEMKLMRCMAKVSVPAAGDACRKRCGGVLALR